MPCLAYFEFEFDLPFYMKVPFQCFLCTCEHVLSITDETPTSRPGSRSAGILPGARPASALASVMSVLMGNPERLPFSVEPNIGAIEPGALQNFNIRFSPLEVGQFQGRLLCRYNKTDILKNKDQPSYITVKK